MTPDYQATAGPGYGALVISLDFELHWGVCDTIAADGPHRAKFVGARKAIPRLLDIFDEFDVGATWATVGFLFAQNRQDREEYSPIVRPEYRNPALDTYRQPAGESEADDPLHYAPSLIDEILRCPRQEMATHTFSHCCCREEGMTGQAFREDLRSAVRIAARQGVRLRSLVFPRNQFVPEYAHILKEQGISSYRTERHWMYAGQARARQKAIWRRAARILDNYINLAGSLTTGWEDIPQPDGLFAIPSSRFLRPWTPGLARLEPHRLERILHPLGEAARQHRIYHLNWHPHNFGVNFAENMRMLRSILEAFARYRDSHGLRAISMQEVAAALTPHQPEREEACKSFLVAGNT